MKNNQKIIDKICKCLRLSESGNPNEAALALRQAQAMMQKYGITDAQVLAAEIEEGVIEAGERYNPPFWALALANLVAEAFQCRNLISRRYGRRPEFKFIGLGYKVEVATYSYAVLHRNLQRAIDDFLLSVKPKDLLHKKESAESQEIEEQRRVEVFAQAWLFRVGRTITEFIGENADKESIDEYIEEKYGETVELTGNPTETQQADYDDILCGMRAANEVALYRSVGRFVAPQFLNHKQAS